MEDVKDVLVRHLEFSRQNQHDDYELEIRCGRYNKEGHFVPGYSSDELIVIHRLMKSLDTKVAEKPGQWRKAPDMEMIRSDFGNGLRLTSTGTGTAEYQRKTIADCKNANEDVFASNRAVSFRIRLSKEESINMSGQIDPNLRALLTQKSPLSVRVLRRRSYHETVPIGTETIVFRYDITKVSESAVTKQQAIHDPSRDRYHVELELVSKLRPWSNIELGAAQNQLVAAAFLQRAHRLLGDFALEGERKRALLPAQLSLIHESQRPRVGSTHV